MHSVVKVVKVVQPDKTGQEMGIELAARRYVTVGVAVAGASLIAVTPVAPPLADIRVPVVQLSAAEGLLDDVPGSVGGLENAVSGAGGASGPIGDLLNPLAELSGSGGSLNLGDLFDPFAGLFNLADPTPYTLVGPVQLFTDTVASLQGLAQ